MVSLKELGEKKKAHLPHLSLSASIIAYVWTNSGIGSSTIVFCVAIESGDRIFISYSSSRTRCFDA